MEPETETKDAQSFDLMLELDADDTQGEVMAECGCLLECTEYTVGLIYCEQHRSAPDLLREALEYVRATYDVAAGDHEPHFVTEARNYGIQ
jgi:hypothetical protein